MAYPIRHFEPQTIYFLTSRTAQSRFLLAPSDKTNELIGGILARAVRQCEVELFAYVFMSNHFHLMVRAPTAIAMSKFMQRLQSNLAIKVGRFVRWRGPFFARRYSAEPIVDEKAQLARLVYILSHGVKEGLVSKVRRWPGLSCAQALLEGAMTSLHRWRNWTRRWKLEAHADINVDRFSEECPGEVESLTLTPLPCWAALTAPQRSSLVAQLVAKIDADAPNKSERGVAHITAQNPRGEPEQTKLTPRPKAHAANTPLWIEAVRRYRAFVAAFRQASLRWLDGDFNVEFPMNCFRPPPWSVPARIV